MRETRCCPGSGQSRQVDTVYVWVVVRLLITVPCTLADYRKTALGVAFCTLRQPCTVEVIAPMPERDTSAPSVITVDAGPRTNQHANLPQQSRKSPITQVAYITLTARNRRRL